MPKKKRDNNESIDIVHQLEAAVLSNDVEGATSILSEQDPEYTARALGLACRFCGPEMVQALLVAGATFTFPDKGRNHILASYPDPHLDGVFRKLSMARTSYMFPEVSIGDFDEGRQVQPAHTRKLNLQALLDNHAINAEEFLFHALCWDDMELVDYLAAKGYRLTTGEGGFGSVVDGSMDWENSTESAIFARSMFQRVLHLDDGAKMVRILRRMAEVVSMCKPVRLWLADSGVFDYESSYQPSYAKKAGFRVGPKHIRPVLCSSEAFEWIVENTDILDHASKRQMMYTLVDLGNAQGLVYAFEHKWVRGTADFQFVMEYAQSLPSVSAEINAVLLAESKKLFQARKRGTKDLELKNGTTVAELGKLWSYRVNADDTLTITSYKGTDTNVVVPEKIGRRTVTAIDRGAFDPQNQRVTERRRKARAGIVSVEIPGTVRSIEPSTFSAHMDPWHGNKPIASHPVLERVILHEGTVGIGAEAFFGCTGLEEINFPSTLTMVDPYAFAECTSLTEAIFTSQSEIDIEEGAFFACSSLVNVQVPESTRMFIESDAFERCVRLNGWDAYRGRREAPRNKRKKKKKKKKKSTNSVQPTP